MKRVLPAIALLASFVAHAADDPGWHRVALTKDGNSVFFKDGSCKIVDLAGSVQCLARFSTKEEAEFVFVSTTFAECHQGFGVLIMSDIRGGDIPSRVGVAANGGTLAAISFDALCEFAKGVGR